MSSRSRTIAAGLAVLGLVFVSCDSQPPDSPTGPTSPAPTVVGLEIGAPPRIAPGESVQLTATLVKSDGSRENAGDRVGWLSDASSTLAVTQAGLARGLAPGEATVRAVFDRFSGQVRVFVLQPGTFKLSGVIMGSGLGIADVTVTVLSGVGEGLTAKTPPDGQYALYGVSGRVRVSLRRHGFSERFEVIDVSDHHRFDVQLEPDPSTTTGTWTLTITAGSCALGDGTLPAAARTRRYTVQVVEQRAERFSMEGILSGADFIIVNGTGNRLSGFWDDQARIRINFLPVSRYDYYYYYSDPFPADYSILERLGPDTALAIVGQLDTRITVAAIEGAFAGSFRLIRNPPYGPVEAQCDSAAHDFEMRRR